MISNDASLIEQYFPNLSAKQKEQFEAIQPIYRNWNSRINLISRKDIDNLYLRHVLHSLSIAKVIQFKPDTRIIDVGTGGGFPGIPLAILFPMVHFHLIDSIGKKIRTVQSISQELGLTNVSTQVSRAEAVVGQFDFVLGRGVTQPMTFYNWVKHLIAPSSKHALNNGVLYLTGENHIAAPINYHLYPLNEYFQDAFFETKQLLHLYH